MRKILLAACAGFAMAAARRDDGLGAMTGHASTEDDSDAAPMACSISDGFGDQGGGSTASSGHVNSDDAGGGAQLASGHIDDSPDYINGH